LRLKEESLFLNLPSNSIQALDNNLLLVISEQILRIKDIEYFKSGSFLKRILLNILMHEYLINLVTELHIINLSPIKITPEYILKKFILSERELNTKERIRIKREMIEEDYFLLSRMPLNLI
jgi:hypothetical protein